MLEKIRLRNFQAHQDLKISFDPHITTIIGPSDVGKSSVMRAIRWTVLNKPSGESFISEGKEFASVLLVLDSGRRIQRRRGRGRNEYLLDKEKFAAFGNCKVPEPIASVLNMGDINFQGQFDAPFWFSESGMQISRNLNKIVDLGLIDSSLSNIAKYVKQSKNQVDSFEKRYLMSKSRCEFLKHVKKMAATYFALDKRAKTVKDTEDALNALISALRKIYRLRKRITLAKEILNDAEVVLRNGTSWEIRLQEFQNLRGQVREISDLQNKIDKMSDVPDISYLEKTAKAYIQAAKKYNKLRVIIENIKTLEKTICRRRDEYERARDRFQSRIGETCPLCGNAIKS